MPTKLFPCAHALCLMITFFFGATASARTNIVPVDGKVMLLSSATLANMPINSPDIQTRAQKNAASLCSVIHKRFKGDMKIHDFSESELEEMARERVFKASVRDEQVGGLSFREATFHLEQFQKEAATSEKIEMACWAGSVASFVGGGFSTLLMAIGFEGGTDPYVTMITGCVTLGLTGLGAIGAGAARLYRRCTKKELQHDEEIPMEEISPRSLYALPLLAREIWCE